jgi:hypothetical protein
MLGGVGVAQKWTRAFYGRQRELFTVQSTECRVRSGLAAWDGPTTYLAAMWVSNRQRLRQALFRPGEPRSPNHVWPAPRGRLTRAEASLPEHDSVGASTSQKRAEAAPHRTGIHRQANGSWQPAADSSSPVPQLRTRHRARGGARTRTRRLSPGPPRSRPGPWCEGRRRQEALLAGWWCHLTAGVGRAVLGGSWHAGLSRRCDRLQVPPALSALSLGRPHFSHALLLLPLRRHAFQPASLRAAPRRRARRVRRALGRCGAEAHSQPGQRPGRVVARTNHGSCARRRGIAAEAGDQRPAKPVWVCDRRLG